MIYKKILFVCIACCISLIGNAQLPEIELPRKLTKWFVDTKNQEIPHAQTKQLNSYYIQGGIPLTIVYKDTLTNAIIAIEYSTKGDWSETFEKFYFKDGILYYKYTKTYFANTYYTPQELGITYEEQWARGKTAKTLEYTVEHAYYTNNKVIRYAKQAILPRNNTIDYDAELQKIPFVRTEKKDRTHKTAKADLKEVFEIIDLFD